MQKLWKSLGTRVDLMVLLVCLLLTYTAWNFGIKNDNSQELALENKNDEVVTILSKEVESIFTFIDGVSGLYVASNEVSMEELSLYMKSTSQNKLHEEVLRISFIAKTPNKDIPAYEQIVRKGGQPEYTAQVVPEYPEQYVVSQTVDKKGTNYPVSGLNLLTEPARRQMIDELIAGSVVGIARVDSLITMPEYTGKGLIFAVPVIKNNELVGLVAAVVSQDGLISQIESSLGSKWGWNWYQNDEKLASRELDVNNLMSVANNITVTPNSRWKFELHAQKTPSMLWSMVLGGGVLFSFLLYIVVYALTSANMRGEELARVMTADLQKFKLALDSANNHIVITDADGIVLYANKAAQNLTGFELAEMLGHTPRLWGGQMAKDFYVNFWKEIKENKKVFSGIFTNKRKNGALYSAEATVSPITDVSGELVGFVGVEEDVTNEKRNILEREQNVQKLEEFNKTLNNNQIAMVNLLEDSRDLEKQLAEEKKGVEQKIIERTKELRDEEAKLMASITALPRALVIVDVEGNIVVQNSKLEGIFGKIEGDWSIAKIDESLGNTFNLRDKLNYVLKEKKIFDIDEFVFGQKYLKVYMAPVIGTESELIGAVITIDDATEEKILARSKDEFFSIASHELRTPLTAIRGNTSMMLDYYKDTFKDPELKQMMDDTHEASVRLIGIVNDFLDMSRLEMGKVQYKIEDVNLVEIAQKVVKDLDENAKTKGVELKTAGDKSVIASADIGKVEQILFNMIGNSLKFTEKGSVTINVTSLGDKARIEIEDTGKGIAIANQGLLFHKFQQAGSSLMTREGAKGTGLGLYISRLMAEGMGGKLELVKSVEGKGSVFGVVLPLKEIKK